MPQHAATRLSNLLSEHHMLLTRRAVISPVTFGALDIPDVQCPSSFSSSSSSSSLFRSGSSLSLRRFWGASSGDAVLLRPSEVAAISNENLRHLTMSMQRVAQRRAEGLPCLVSKAAAKAASKSASRAAELGWLASTDELGWLHSTLCWLPAYLESLTDNQLLQATSVIEQEVYRRTSAIEQEVYRQLDRSRANADETGSAETAASAARSGTGAFTTRCSGFVVG